MAGQLKRAAVLAAEFLPLPSLNKLEQENLKAMGAELAGSIKKGVDFVHRSS